MIQMKRTPLLPSILITTMLALVMTLVHAPQQVEACGSYMPLTEKEKVQRTVVRHLIAVTRGKASRRGVKNRESKMSWDIERVDVDKKAAFAKVSITSRGQKRIEYLTLLKDKGSWTLVSTVRVATKPKPQTKFVTLH